MTKDERLLLIQTATAVNNWALGFSPSTTEREQLRDVLSRVSAAAMNDYGDEETIPFPPVVVSYTTVTKVERVEQIQEA